MFKPVNYIGAVWIEERLALEYGDTNSKNASWSGRADQIMGRYVTLGWEKSSSSEHKTKDEVLVDLLLDGR